MNKRQITVSLTAGALFASLVGCQAPASSSDLQQFIAPQNPSGGTVPPTVAPTHRSFSTDVLLYTGSGVSSSDWRATESIVRAHGWSYQLVDAAGLNAMAPEELAQFGTFVVPGGTGSTITQGITAATRLRLRNAVRNEGVGYVGFCAGAWVAVGPEATTQATASYGFAIAPGAVLSAYYPGGNTSLTAAVVPVTLWDRSIRHLVWWGGPATPNWTNGVIGRYETGEPAISEVASGNGLVVIAGPHPEAPVSWRATAGADPDGLDEDLAVSMIDAAITGIPLPTL